MAAIVTGCLGAVGGKVGELILGQFKYLCCYSANITNLRNEAEKLKRVVISGEVETSLQKSNEIKREIDGILNEVPNVGSGCFSLGARFSLSKRAEETTERLKELLGEYKFDTNPISLQRTPASMPIPSEMSYDFDSRKNIEDGIMATLRDGDVNMIGICGMGGLGKTTMARRIKNRALREHVFEEVAMVVVSQPPIDKLKIQLEIGGSLGLKLQGKCSEARVQKLHERLSGTKRILLVLDDVWEILVPEDLGIPRGYKECTILLTSRNHDVLSAMNVQKIIRMKVLSEEDSWLLFKERVGTCVDDTKLISIAKEIVNECKGLPIALTTVGAALKDKMKVPIWQDALEQLRRCEPDIPEIIANIYNPLRLSYNGLTSYEKSIFLLCCLFPEDAHIPLEILTYFCMGLSIFGRGIKNARNKMCALTEKLKSQSLLLDSEYGDDYVRMHDVIRDVCIFIARKEGYLSDNDCNWTSSLQRYELPSGLGLLWIGEPANKEFKFDGIRDLRVVIIGYCSLTSLPFTQMPKTLTTLVLGSCEGLEALSVVGELVSLEILICQECNSIEELPQEIKGLNRLKVLDLMGCKNLKRIGPDIVSSLVGLEELTMLGSFKKWEGEDREERENAGLKELGQLPNLRCLEIEIEDLALAAENIRPSLEVDRFTIRFLYKSRWFSKFDEYLSNKKMCLKWEGATCLGDWIKMLLLRDIECLLLVGNGANEVGLRNLEKIRYLELAECESMKKVVTSSMDERGATVFPSIEHLILFNLPKLEEICDDRISSNSFQNLKILKLDDLPELKQLWKSSQNDLGKDFLPQLEVLEIKRCDMMEAVFLWKGEEANENNSCHHTTKRFPKLKELQLNRLPNLISLCQGIEGIEFPLMRKLDISRCWKMKGMVWNENISGGSSNNASIHALFYAQQVLFGCLKKLDTDRNPFSELEELKIFGCHGILSIFTSSMAGNLVNLQRLEISCCGMMEGVFLWKGEEGNENNSCHPITIRFPKLKELNLSNLPNLISLCQGIEGIEFPLMRKIEISECGKMKGMVWNEKISGGSSNNASIHGLFCPQQVLFGGLKKLDTDRNTFSQLEELRMFSCQDILSLFTSSMAGNLVNLKELDISYCDEMVEVIKDEEEKGAMSGGRKRALLFPKLHTLELRSLPKLVSFCDSKGIESIQFPVLREMTIRRCRKMKGMVANGLTSNDNNSGGSNINARTHLFCESQLVSFGCIKKLQTDWNPFCRHTIPVSIFNGLEELRITKCPGSVCLFTSSMAGNLVNLEVLVIGDCEEMVEVIKDEEEKDMSGGRQRALLLFPKLHMLQLSDLPKLVSFCDSKGIESIQFEALRSMEIRGCEKMKGMVANGLTSNDNNSGGSNINAHTHLFCESQLVSFGRVKKLEIVWNPFSSHTIHVSQFNGLEELTIHRCEGSLSLFTSSVAGNLLHLKELSIEECDEMVQVIIDDEETGMSGGERASLFPKLHKIYLSKLSKLVSFCELKCDVEFPSLRQVTTYNCPNMKNFTLGSLAAPNLKYFNTDLKNDLLQVPFISPKQLSVFGNEKPLNCYQIHGSVFDRLEELDIIGYYGSMSLFSSSITGNLVNLTTLTIELCPKMVKVIEEEEEEKEEEKEKVVSAAQTTTILFPKLQQLHLRYLNSLVRFCEWKCDVELPSLRELEIRLCNNMKSFTLGHLNTPKLESVNINRKGVGGVKDLNGLVPRRGR